MKGQIFIFMTLLLLLSGRSAAQNNLIGQVPDYVQPPAKTLPSTTDVTNYCSPFAALNIIAYWEQQKNPYALGATAGLPAGAAAAYIGWFMGTNGQGSPLRHNAPPFVVPGTFVIDQSDGMSEYLQSDSLQLYGFPHPFPGRKRSVLWDVMPEPPDYAMYTSEIDQGNPLKLDFLHWNIVPAGPDTVIGGDTVAVYSWGSFIDHSGSVDESDPPEQWNGEEGDLGIGHSVTGIGYLAQFYYPATPGPPLDYAVVHDNWPNTPENIAVPWQNIQAVFHVRLPRVPDLTITDMETRSDSLPAGTLYAGSPFDLVVTVENRTGPWLPPFIASAAVLNPDGTPLAADTSFHVYTVTPGLGSTQVSFDSIYVPPAAGSIDLTVTLHWDLNRDSLINDPADGDSLNDFSTISRTVSWRIVPVLIERIPGVPDHNQPPAVTLPSTLPGNFCAPLATANILHFWDIIAGHSNARNVTGGLPPETVAEYLGWFYDTNDRGNPGAMNGTGYPSASGTYAADQDSFLWHFIRWDSLHPYMAVAPALPVMKAGYDWYITSDHQTGAAFIKTEINAGRPVKLDFSHWNISFTGQILVDTLDQDSVFLYQWGPPVGNAQAVYPEAPEEAWNLAEGDSCTGHAVTGVGYTEHNGFHVVVHDNWPVTHERICIPFRNWQGTLAADPNRTTPVSLADGAFPRSYRLYQNRPNPFNSATVIRFDLPAAAHVRLDVYNILGQRVAVLTDRRLSAGGHRISWDAHNIPSGVYLYRLTAEDFMQLKKCVLLK